LVLSINPGSFPPAMLALLEDEIIYVLRRDSWFSL